VARLSALFTDARGHRRPTYMQDPALRRAYLGFFVPHNVARIALLLLRAAEEGLLPSVAAPRVLDVGAGPLSGLLACWAVWGELGPSHAVDISRTALEDGAALFEAVGGRPAGLTLLDRSLTAPPAGWLPGGGVDVVIAANVLNEIGDPREPGPRLRLVEQLVGALHPGGRILVVEPAMRVEARALMAVRDGIVERGSAAILSPCRGARRCPLLATRGDWCHGDVRWSSRPPAYRQLEQATRLPKETLAATHLLLAPSTTPTPATGLRIVGGVMRDQHGRERRYACGRDLVTLAGTPRLAPRVAQAARGEVIDEAAAAHGADVNPASAPRAPRARSAGAAPGRPPRRRPPSGRGR
jgi:SAM-dependent methyltransferase